MSIITYPLNGIDYVAEDAETYLCTRISGVFSDDDCYSVTVTGTRQITVSPGLAWIQNTDHCGKSVYNSANYKISVPVADGTYDRIDRVVLHFDKYAGETTLKLLTGTPAASPKAPEITQTETIYELGLATIKVGAATVVLDQSNITDTRLDESVCGLMRDAVTGIPTQELYDQWQAWYAKFISTADAQLESEHAEFEAWMTENSYDFNEWFENLQYVLDGDVAGHLELEIENLKEKLQNLKETVYGLHGLLIPFVVYVDEAYTLYFSAGTEIPSVGDKYHGYTVKNVYTDFGDDSSTPGWHDVASEVSFVIIDDEFATVQPKYMDGWFYDINSQGTGAFNGLDKIDTSQCKSMRNLFHNSSLLDKEISSISGWDVSNVETFVDCFCRCKNLTNVDGLANWDISGATSLGEMFLGCSNLETVDLSKWDSRNVVYMISMFESCTALKTIYSNDDVFVTSGITPAYNGYQMFNNCESLVGGNGTRCLIDSTDISSSMAHVDVADNPGYFTKK